MTTSLLAGKQFHCREWAFSKINHCLENRPSSKTCGALIMGGPGCGKTAICCELVWPTATQGRQLGLNKRILAYYFCQAHDIETLSLSSFIHSIVEQLSKCSQIQGYQEQLRDPAMQVVLEDDACERDPDEAFKAGVLMPLHSIPPPSNNLFLLVDSIDESYLQSIGERTSGSRTIAELLANHHHLFPQWLLLIATARKQSKTVTRLFTGFRKISLDDLRKAHVVRDVQQYILMRLDREDELRQHLSRETAEMLNQLHIKSNGCFLYLEKVLDGIAESFIMLREIREIPGTLNGLYLWLCQRLFVRKQFAKIQPILNVILAARRPLTELELYYCAYTRNTNLTLEEFKKRLDLLDKLLIDGKDGTKILFHHSFAEWLLDVKHCTQRFMCNAAEGHGMLAMSFTMNAANLTPVEVQDFALHMSKSNLASAVMEHHLALWLIQSGANVEDSLSSGVPKEPVVARLLHMAGALPGGTGDKSASETGTLDNLQDKDSQEVLKEMIDSGTSINLSDSNGRTMLANAAYNGDVELLHQLLEMGTDLEIEDKNGQTALNLAARQGHVEVVQALLKASACVNHTDSDGWTTLRSAAWGGHLDVVVALLDGGAEVDHADADQRTALRAAAWGGHDDIVLKLLEYGADLNKVDNEGRTALIAAAYMGHTEIVEHLLDHGADINHEDCDGRTALSVAALCIPASEGHAGVVSLLLERGAEVDHRDHDGMTPLLVAAYEGHHEVCELLLESDADVDHADNTCRTPLQAAASMGHARVVNQLLFWGAAVDTIDTEGRTVLSVAAAQGNVEVVQLLLDRGLDELHRDNAGMTPLHIAACEGHKEASEALIEAGARVLELDNEGRIPLSLAAQEGHLEVVRVLLEHGSPINHRQHDGKNILRTAALEGHRDLVQYLIQCGADMNYRDADGRTTLYLLALENQVNVAELLVECGASMELPDIEGRTPLHVAAWQGHYEMCEMLLNRETEVDSVDNDRRTALQSASWQGHVGIVHLLLENGARVDYMCNQGATALCIAAQEGHEEVVKVLLKFKADPNHADQYGRTATRVALKGGHSNIVKILEEYGAYPLNGLNSRAGHMTTPPDIGGYARVGHHLTKSAMCNGNDKVTGNVKSPGGSPGSTADRRKSYLSNYTQSSKSSSNITANSTSTHLSSGTTCADNDLSLSFMQQLQQCSDPRNRTRPVSHVLSPVSEPQSPVQQSPLPSPMVGEAKSLTHKVSPADPRLNMQHGASKTSPKRVEGTASMRIISNPNADLYTSYSEAEEPVWLRHSELARSQDASVNAAKLAMQRKSSLQERGTAGVIMGQAALAMKSPETRRKQNGIVTNPNYSKSGGGGGGGGVNGYFGGPTSTAEGTDNFPATPNGNSHMPTGTPAAPAKPKAVRPTGLPLKKETPL